MKHNAKKQNRNEKKLNVNKLCGNAMDYARHNEMSHQYIELKFNNITKNKLCQIRKLYPILKHKVKTKQRH